MNSVSVYHRKLPETASVPFIALYGIWAMFVLLLAIGLFVLIGQNYASLMADFWQQKGWLLLGLPSVFAVYALWVVRKLYRFMRNRQNIPLILQEIAMMPIPPRSLQRASFTWKPWSVRLYVYQLGEWLRCWQKKPLFVSAVWLLAGAAVYLMDYVWIFLPMLIGLACGAQNWALPCIDYQSDSDVLTITHLSGQNQYDLRRFVGICTVWQPEATQYQIQLINKKKQSVILFASANHLESIAQTISHHTGLPVLQQNIMKVTS